MASIASACRNSARCVSKATIRHGRRGFCTTSRAAAAHNFAMPAMSPTMTEGNIASWKLKEGDSFSTGDVLLEIETDKAQMDVEAQDDGILAKIIQADGSKSVQVGTRIAVLAEPGDDLSSLEIPPEDTSSKPQPSKQDQEPDKKSSEKPAPAASKSADDGKQQGKTGPQKYPLYPSVQHLLKENGLSKEDAESIPSTGPNGRLLKGDVLAYVGKIGKSHPGELSARIEKLAHLDLSNIKLSKPKPSQEKKAAKEEEAEAIKKEDLATELALPISLTEVFKTQKKLQAALGFSPPLTTFIARAVDFANQDLPAKKTSPSANDLFDSVLGLERQKSKTSIGRFVPQMTGFPIETAPLTTSSRLVATKPKPDVLDILAGKSTTLKQARPVPSYTTEANVFSLTVAKDDTKRAAVFLERMKGVLEKDAGMLVL